MIKEFFDPANIWKTIIFIFGLWVTYGTLSYRISVLQIKTTLGKIQTDLEWLKNARIKALEHNQ